MKHIGALGLEAVLSGITFQIKIPIAQVLIINGCSWVGCVGACSRLLLILFCVSKGSGYKNCDYRQGYQKLKNYLNVCFYIHIVLPMNKS